MKLRSKLGEILKSQRLVTQAQLDEALAIQKETSAPLGSILVKMGVIGEDMLLKALAAQMGVTPWHLEAHPPKVDALRLISLTVCERYQMLPVEIRGDLLIVAMRNPLDTEAIDLVRVLSHKRIEPVLANSDKLAQAIQKAASMISVKSSDGQNLNQLVTQALKEFGKTAEVRHEANLDEVDTRPVVGVVNQILSDAIRLGSSDIHIEPSGDAVEVRYRVDGQLTTVQTLPIDIHPMLTTRIKIMSELDIVESRIPQDGRVGAEIDGRKVDLRVSVMPSYHGQRIVLRILDKSIALKSLSEIGFSDHNDRLFRKMISRPHGLILVTGPTGSGKTTTLYSALREIKKTTNNIMTCEDPVEYDISGISQSQINEKIGLSFAHLLRASLRQDPDVILVGEIRDAETAEAAIRASLTGHLVLSTLHANDSIAAVPRLLDMGVDPYLLSTSLVGVTSQRLVRSLCDCKVEESNLENLEMARRFQDRSNPEPLYTAKGCLRCNQSGFRGRMAIHELLPITGTVASGIADRVNLEELRFAAYGEGYRPMYLDAMDRVLDGTTSVDEVRRVVYLEDKFGEAGSNMPVLRAAA